MLEASPNYGLFQIHESSLVPPGQAFIISNPDIWKQDLLEDILKTHSHQIFYGNLPQTFIERPFDYKERAAIEFDLSNESGLR